VIDQFSSALNIARRRWHKEMEPRYKVLLSSLSTAPLYAYEDFPRGITLPGVYVLYHERLPSTVA
jgi:hypothetical protein